MTHVRGELTCPLQGSSGKIGGIRNRQIFALFTGQLFPTQTICQVPDRSLSDCMRNLLSSVHLQNGNHSRVGCHGGNGLQLILHRATRIWFTMLQADKTHIMLGHVFRRHVEETRSCTATTLGRLGEHRNGRKCFWNLDGERLVGIIFATIRACCPFFTISLTSIVPASIASCRSSGGAFSIADPEADRRNTNAITRLWQRNERADMDLSPGQGSSTDRRHGRPLVLE